MKRDGMLLLKRNEVGELLTLRDCIDAVESVFRWQGEGKIPPSGILGVKASGGGLHVKAGLLPGERSYLVVKLNTNYPANRTRFSLPTIQGLIFVCDAENGAPLAILDSTDITIKRTAAASAVAVKFLARQNSAVTTLCGCGAQGRAQLRAIHSVLPLKKVYAFDVDPDSAKNFANELSRELTDDIEPVSDCAKAIQQSDLVITCTTSTQFFVRKEDVRSGTFIAAVGADDEHKQEIDPALMASSKVVADSLDQVCAIGDTHHAIAQGLMRRQDVYAELGEVAAGKKNGRTTGNEIFIFDSTGVAIEDAVSAVAVYERARASGIGSYFEFAA
jgi:alanine dehydrogenase